MTRLNPNIEAFVKLGEFLGEFCKCIDSKTVSLTVDSAWFEKFKDVITTSHHHNGWFTKANVLHALRSWSVALSVENLERWLTHYDLSNNRSKRVALVLAGNIPMVGFHDLLTVLVTGNTAVVKLSSNDTLLLPLLVEYLTEIHPGFKDKVVFTKDRLTHFDAVIATGSNNTARYFEYYFGKKPNIIRKNRNAVAVLTGNETKEQLTALADDIFRYYGLGCRSVSKLFVPKGYDFDSFFKAQIGYDQIIKQHKYANNYDYNKAVYLMSEFKFLDNGFLMVKEDAGYASPIATVFYEEYEMQDDVKTKISADKEHIQCVVSKGLFTDEVPFGKTQSPELWDYADGIDTVEFLLKTS
ncbi:acyl-CoA reductase [Maribacter chungangensis]|uniref:long-chain-fatty-acyl-CoA reductase n=1 Tax=Maribacter chungangensis TaxID=1069117 RepID=A0ABW3B9K4_9FLAO